METSLDSVVAAQNGHLPILLVKTPSAFWSMVSLLLQHQPDIAVIGALSPGQLGKPQTLQPKVILLDFDLPDADWPKTMPRLRKLWPQACIIAITALETEIYRRAILGMGVTDTVAKLSVYTDLLPTIRRCAITPATLATEG